MHGEMVLAGAVAALPAVRKPPRAKHHGDTAVEDRAGFPTAGRRTRHGRERGDGNGIMIDIARERLIAIHEVPAWLPRRQNGRKVHISAVYRWVSRGIRGIKLDAVRIGGTTYSSTEALQRFADAVTQATSSVASPSVTPRYREREIARAADELDRLLRGKDDGA